MTESYQGWKEHKHIISCLCITDIHIHDSEKTSSLKVERMPELKIRDLIIAQTHRH